MRKRVVIADDHALMREGVRRALEEAGFTVCAEAADAPGAVAAAERERPDACLLDVHMPGGGISAAAAIAQRVPSCEVVMLTVSRDDGDLFDALRAGASGYLLKDMEPERLPAALEQVLDGESVLHPSLVGRLVREFRGRARPPLARLPGDRLSSREWEVLGLMEGGLGTSEIAARMGVSPVTVRRHVGAILQKLRVPDRAAALRLLAERRAAEEAGRA